MKFLGSKTGLKSEILAKLAYGPPYRFYANEPYIYISGCPFTKSQYARVEAVYSGLSNARLKLKIG